MIKLKTLTFVFLLAFFVSFPGVFQIESCFQISVKAANPLEDWTYRANQTVKQNTCADVNYSIPVTAYYNETPISSYIMGRNYSHIGQWRINNTIRGEQFTSSYAGSIDWIKGYFGFSWPYQNHKVKCAIYYETNDSLVAETEERVLSSGLMQQFNFSSSVSIYAATQYILVAWANKTSGYVELRAEASGNGRYKYNEVYGDFPDPGGFSNQNHRFSIWTNVSYILPQSNNTVFLNKHCNANFSDVRFVDDDETTVLNYFLSHKTDGVSASYWVQLQDNLTAGDVLYYIYYGNPAANYTGSGFDVFPFFDDFNDASLNASLWTTDTHGGGAVSESGGEVLLDVNPGVSSDSAGIRTVTNFTNSIEIGVRRKQITANGYYIGLTLGAGASCDESGGSSNWWLTTTHSSYYLRQYEPQDATHTNGIYYMAAAGGGVAINISGVVNPDSANYHVYQGRYSSGGKIDFLVDDVSKFSGTNTTYLNTNKTFLITQGCYARGGGNYGKDTLIDWVYVRDYCEPEPVLYAWGSEQLIPVLSPALFWAVLIFLFVATPGAIIISGGRRK